MVFSNIIVDITISCRSFVLSRSRAKVSSGLINVSSLTVVAFYLEKLLCLSSTQFVFVLDVSN